VHFHGSGGLSVGSLFLVVIISVIIVFTLFYDTIDASDS